MASYNANYFDETSKQCSNCEFIKPHEAFSPIKKAQGLPLTSGSFLHLCRECKAKENIYRNKAKKLEKYPGLYWECKECDDLTHRNKGYCDNCGSEK